ncbi:GNAT family N-acetyltransferase [Halioglobus maricola]|uniref:GNAT family N-acetyltransferase n=1 Tax=Halioglobus maricola TaxID=2601894 RepID=UPI001F0D6F48|nr:GNAT family N-acetyltransferase [Halioglobus maricola]
MVFREAIDSDLALLREFEQRVIEAERPYNSAIKSEPTTYYDIESLISDRDSQLLLAETDNEIVATGYAQIRSSKASLKHAQHAYLGFMYVSPKHRGQGINSMLIEQLISWCEQRSVQNFYLDVYALNRSAIKAYEKLGFRPSMVEMSLSRE